MRKILPLVLVLGLAGCAGGPGQIDDAVKQVQSYAVGICKYLPTAATVAAIISAAPIIATAGSIGAQICTAVTNLPLAEGPGRRRAMVYGVPVRGRFVK